MALSSAERFRRFKTKLQREGNELLLKEFQEKDAVRNLKSHQLVKQNRIRQAKRLVKLASEKLGSQVNQLSLSSASTTASITCKCAQTLAKAVHRAKRGFPVNPTKKEEIIRHLAMKHEITAKPLALPKLNHLSEVTKSNVIQFYQLDEISSVAPDKKDVITVKSPDGSKIKHQKRYLVMTV
ncbi:unnamed protein product [Rotaria sp. Silwood2]|nr:unnamed protein product [Rotaria sp. Silwood2]CAF3013539.1 unnamed protein product [Rotaria sp. Silwood2]CAF4050966.1 unnamed protein product [Rotaria sp. Silwood2]CAF4287295.1 unnamed protein product [Rotaria sp. Silwood2]